MKRLGLIISMALAMMALMGCLASTKSPDGVVCKSGIPVENENPDCTGGG
ncbi:hypothetical protein [Polynucleobacter asymbioticus]|nr:hypothetical protein [Polynucleobacter asymbioticus]